ncbi:MAG: L-threonylcarbamoyladenylate synthase [Isosphaerales bacterium]
MSHRLTTRVLVVDPGEPDPAVLDRAARVLLRGGLVAFATETVYGLGAIATLPAAVARIFAAKGRPAINPVIVHVAGIAQARDCVAEWTDEAECLARRFWPGPLTLVLKRAESIPDVVTAGRDTVAVRAPAGKVALGLIERSGKPIAAPSANRSNRLSPTRAKHVLADLAGAIDLLIDSGPTEVGLESTVLDLTTARPRLLRPGPISIKDLESALFGRRVVEPIADEPAGRPSSPGQMPVHYAPRTPSFRVERGEDLGGVVHRGNTAVVSFGEQADRALPAAVARFTLESPAEASRRLYDVLHHCDSLGLDSIVVVMPPADPEWQAVRDRLVRATRPLKERE